MQRMVSSESLFISGEPLDTTSDSDGSDTRVVPSLIVPLCGKNNLWITRYFLKATLNSEPPIVEFTIESVDATSSDSPVGSPLILVHFPKGVYPGGELHLIVDALYIKFIVYSKCIPVALTVTIPGFREIGEPAKGIRDTVFYISMVAVWATFAHIDRVDHVGT